ncbi:uncharacterized protein LOC107366687 isoform X2 [Tetranychus urticae]|uniref:uncharacterized protein LOC107366687 isoform X2 n=1 Tax=Tetranychus urticae TaxID=32264 RepID=UPI000D64A798|nr:uncharacterized protein LOC107366687 isoform X2 [Tetranychus urticae]
MKGINAITLEHIHVPSHVMVGDSVWLNCTYDLQGDELYSIKWYKNSVEFYRYLPKSDPPKPQGFICDGIYLDLSKSTLGNVFLNTTDLNSQGDYKCEVSAEEPSFKTVRKIKPLRVYSNGSSHMIKPSSTLWNGLLIIIIITFTTWKPSNGLSSL